MKNPETFKRRNTPGKELVITLIIFASVVLLAFVIDINWTMFAQFGMDTHHVLFVSFILLVLLISSLAVRRWWELQKEVTARTIIERKLRDSRSQLAAAQEVAHVGSWEWNPATNAVQWSDEMFRIFGLSPQQFDPVLDDYVKRIHDEDRDIIMQTVTLSLHHKDSFSHSHRVVWPDGTVRNIDARGEVVTDQAGTVTKMIGTAQDVTERTRYEQRLHHTNDALDRSVRELERRNQEMNLLHDLSGMLQSCVTDGEAYRVVARYLPRFFPSSVGNLFVIAASQNSVEEVASWGGSTSRDVHAITECRGLRNGRPYLTDVDSNIVCPHITDSCPGRALCVPMMAQGEAFGILYIGHVEQSALQSDSVEQSNESAVKLGTTLADNIALALANLKLRETLQEQAVRDPLTGLFNRRYMEVSFERELSRAERNGTSLAVVLVDLDHFKHFNDTKGHAAGDAVLRELGTFFQTNTRTEDIACRYGGEEFVLILPDTSLDNAVKRAEELREVFKQLEVQYRGQTLGAASLSLGVAAFPEHGQTVDDLLRTADSALYKAKSTGRDRVVPAGWKDAGVD